MVKDFMNVPRATGQASLSGISTHAGIDMSLGGVAGMDHHKQPCSIFHRSTRSKKGMADKPKKAPKPAQDSKPNSRPIKSWDEIKPFELEDFEKSKEPIWKAAWYLFKDKYP